MVNFIILQIFLFQSKDAYIKKSKKDFEHLNELQLKDSQKMFNHSEQVEETVNYSPQLLSKILRNFMLFPPDRKRKRKNFDPGVDFNQPFKLIPGKLI